MHCSEDRSRIAPEHSPTVGATMQHDGRSPPWEAHRFKATCGGRMSRIGQTFRKARRGRSMTRSSTASALVLRLSSSMWAVVRGWRDPMAKRGARVAGLDASMASIAIARARVPGGTFNVGEMEELPFGDASVNVVTSFNAFQYAASPVKALREAFRVLQPGGQVAMVTWGQAHQCEHAATLAAVGACLPPPPPGAGGPLRCPNRAGSKNSCGMQAQPARGGEVACPFAYPDEDTALRAICSAGPVVRAVRHAGKHVCMKQCGHRWRRIERRRAAIASKTSSVLSSRLTDPRWCGSVSMGE